MLDIRCAIHIFVMQNLKHFFVNLKTCKLHEDKIHNITKLKRRLLSRFEAVSIRKTILFFIFCVSQQTFLIVRNVCVFIFFEPFRTIFYARNAFIWCYCGLGIMGMVFFFFLLLSGGLRYIVHTWDIKRAEC